MTRLRHPVLLASIALVSCAGSGTDDEAPEGCLLCGPIDVDFGVVRTGELVPKRLLVKNEGSRPALLRPARLPEDLPHPFQTDFRCDRTCEVAEVRPGATIELDFSFAPTQDGSYEHELALGVEGSRPLILRLRGEAEVPAVECEGGDLGKLEPHEAVARVLRCRNKSRIDLYPLLSGAPPEPFRIEVKRGDHVPAGEEFELDVIFGGAGELRTYHASFELKEEVVDGAPPLAQVALSLTVVDSTVEYEGLVNDPCLDFGEVAVGSSSTRTITVRNVGFMVRSYRLDLEATGESPFVLEPRQGALDPDDRATPEDEGKREISATFAPASAGLFTVGLRSHRPPRVGCLSGRGI